MKNAIARSGALGNNAMNPRQTGVVRTIGDNAFEFIVRATKKGHVVGVETNRMVHPRERYRDSYRLEQTIDVPLDEDDSGYSEQGSLDWLCLDMLEAADIDHYLESRLDRSSYMQFYGMLLTVRDHQRIEDWEMAPIIAKLEKAYAASPVPLPKRMTSRDLARHAIRLWRANNRGAMVPPAEDAAHAAAYKILIGNMWTLAGNDHPIEEAEALAREQGRTPIRLVMTGRNRFVLYATSVGDEIEDRLFDHVWVTRLSCQRKNGGLKVTSSKVMLMPDAVADEETLHEWPASKEWKGRTIPAPLLEQVNSRERDILTYDVIRKSVAAVQNGSLSAFHEKPEDLERSLLLLGAARKRQTKKSKYVVEIDYVQPFGIIRRTAFKSKPVEGFSARYETHPVTQDYAVLTLQDRPYRMLYRLCDTDEEREKVVAAFSEQYEQKKSQARSFLNSVRQPPQIGLTWLADWAKLPEDPLERNSTWQHIPLEANWSENARLFDVVRRRHTYGDEPESFWSPRLDEMLVWMDPGTPHILNEMCRRFGWTSVPFVPRVQW